MEKSWQDLLCRVYLAGYEDCQRERDYDPMGHETVDTAKIKAEKMEQRVFMLEVELKELLDYAEDSVAVNGENPAFLKSAKKLLEEKNDE